MFLGFRAITAQHFRAWRRWGLKVPKFKFSTMQIETTNVQPSKKAYFCQIHVSSRAFSPTTTIALVLVVKQMQKLLKSRE